MCRLFGFKSITSSQVHSSLVNAENALGQQSERHPNGWGVAYYREDVPHVIKSAQKAFDDHIFHHVSGVVSAQTVIAHIRTATQGSNTILNSHPFQIGRWTFAHNGNIKNFDKYKIEILNKISPQYLAYVLGDTDSELIFALLINRINDSKDPTDAACVLATLKKCMQELVEMIGPLCDHDHAVPTENYLTFVLTDGKMLFAHQGGQPLYMCTYKKKCPEKDSCPHYAPMCEAPPSSDKKVNHVIFSSEPIQEQNVWNKLKAGSLIGVSEDMKLIEDSSDVEFTN